MLIDSLKILLADMFAFRLKSQFYHWNIEGPNFIQYHEYLGKLYTQADANVDTIAEHIRSLDVYVPGSFKRFAELATIEDEEVIPTPVGMFTKLLEDNLKLHASMKTVHDNATTEKQFGIVNFIEGLLDENEKTTWILKSIKK